MVADAVRSVLAGRSIPEELVIVDQSREPNAELASLGPIAACDVRYVHSHTAGASRGRNIGLVVASSDVVVILDDDMLVEPEWLGALVAALPEGETAIATGQVLAGPPEVAGGDVPAATLFVAPNPVVHRGRQAGDVVPGAGVALPRQLALALGGYDERLGPGTRYHSAEDNDLALRLVDAGCAVHHEPRAIAIHRRWREADDVRRLRWRYGRGKGAFYAKHLSLRDRYVLGRMGRDIVMRGRRIAVGVVRSPRAALGDIVYLAGVASGATEWLLTQRVRVGRRADGH
jgi:GT2 family glycosyltransferase